jgi:hypothetical protein
MPAFNTNEDIGLQSSVLQVDADTTIIGDAPQYIKNGSGVFVAVTEDDPYWQIKKIFKSGGNKITTRNADGSNRYNKIFSQWASYTY